MGAREITIVVSLALHLLVGVIALDAAHEKKRHAATTIALAEEKKKEKAKAKPPEPPKPPPVLVKPKPAPPRVAAAVAPPPTPAPTTETVAPPSTAPVATDISMGNDTGMDLGTGHPQTGETRPGAGSGSGAVRPKPAAAAVKTPIHVDKPPPPVSVDGVCSEPPGKPEPTSRTEIEYTEEARAAGIEGRLVLKVTVDADGNVTSVVVVSPVDGALDAAAVATVKTWRFKPAYACGKPVAGGTYTIARRFVLGD